MSLSSGRKVGVGIIGCGKISDQYFIGCKRYDVLEIVACADLDQPRARVKAREHGVSRAVSTAELLADPDIEIVVNLTIPAVHSEVNEAILAAGKHVYVEKPLALDSASSARVVEFAGRADRLLACAPDTFMGGGIQSARGLLDAGAIGEPVAAMAFMLSHGPESWHPAPEFYYLRGGGPMFDMGPYYLTALVNFFGPMARISGTARKSFPERLITSQPLAGKKAKVEVPTHYAGTIDFANGAVATIVTSFDVWPGPAFPNITLFGSEGTMVVPDPNHFTGNILLRSAGATDLQSVPLTHQAERGRGTGVADLAYSILRRGRPVRANGELAHHVVEAMEAFDRASASGEYVTLASSCERPPALPDLPANVLDA
ncbi:MAG: Gfo/Idh/MocA family protein [Opitutaceae bacterium]